MSTKDFMKIAISLAKRGFGKTSPNPSVGAVIVRDGEVIGKGYHRGFGLAHAEVEAIRNAEKEGHVFLFEESQGLGRLKAALNDHGSSHMKHRKRKESDTPDMEHRQDKQIPILLAEIHIKLQVDRIPETRPLGEDCPFWPSGRTRRVHYYMRCILSDLPVGNGIIIRIPHQGLFIGRSFEYRSVVAGALCQ